MFVAERGFSRGFVHGCLKDVICTMFLLKEVSQGVVHGCPKDVICTMFLAERGFSRRRSWMSQRRNLYDVCR